MIQNKLFLTLIIIFFSISKEEFTNFDFLRTDGTQIKNNFGSGNCVYLRGTNLGNLFVQENWMSSTNEKDQKTINEKLTKRFGKNFKDNLISFYENNYFTLSDFDKLKEMGMSVIRVPFT